MLPSSFKWLFASSAAIVLILSAAGGVADAATYRYVAGLSDTFYSKTCPNATKTVHDIVNDLFLSDVNNDLPAALVRLHFHDCFVRGCDASVLIKSTPGNRAERDAAPNKNSLEGFEIIDKLKSAVEDICPGVVSCADIVALAARDSLLVSRGVWYPVPLGRRDGVVSKAAEAEANLPANTLNYTGLVKNFAAQGLTPKDMVVLSGAHTIGDTHCKKIWSRLWNFSSTVKTDPALDKTFAAQQKLKCPQNQPLSTRDVLLDPTKGGQFFDSLYYKNVLAGKTAFISDSALITDPAGRSLVSTFAANPSTPFFQEFGSSMVKMGQIRVLTGKNGVIRKVCSKV